MSRFETGGVYSSSSRYRPAEVGVAPADALDAPGLDVAAPDMSGARALGDFAQAMGMAGDLAVAVRREQELTKARSEREAEQIASVKRGNGAAQAEIEYQKLLSRVESGEIPIESYTDDKGMVDSSKATNALLDMATSGMDPDTAEGYRRRAGGPLASGVQRFIDKGKEASLTLSSKAMASDAVTAKTAEELSKAHSAALGLFRGDKIAAGQTTLLPALQAAAESGDQARFDMVVGTMGTELFAGEIERAKVVLASRVEQKQRDTERVAINGVDRLFNNGGSIESVLAKIDDERKAGRIDDTSARNMNELYISKMKQRDKDLLGGISVRQETDARSSLADFAAKVMDAGDQLGGSSAIESSWPKTIEIPLANGSTAKIQTKEIVDAAWAQTRANIDELTPDPQQRLALRMDYMRKNPTLTDPEIEGSLRGITGRFSPGMGVNDVPQSAIQGMDLYRRMVASGGQEIADRHLTESDKDFMRATSLLSKSTGIDAASALDVANKMRSDPSFSQTLRGGLSERDTLDISTKFDGKAGEYAAKQAVRERAQAYMALGAAKEDAIVKATVDFGLDYLDFNGYPVLARGFKTRGDVQAITNGVTEASKAWAVSKGVDPSKFVLLPVGDRGVWQMRYEGLALDPEAPTFTDDDLLAVHKETERLRADKATLEAIQIGRTNVPRQFGSFMDPINIIGRSIGAVRRAFGEGTDPSDASKLPPAPEPPEKLKFVFDYLRSKDKPKPPSNTVDEKALERLLNRSTRKQPGEM